MNQSYRQSCTRHIIGQNRPNRLKRGLMVLLTPLCKGRPRLLKSEQYILVYGAPKIVSLTNFHIHHFLGFLRGIVCWRQDRHKYSGPSGICRRSRLGCPCLYCETVSDSTGYCCRPPEPLRPLQAKVPRGVAAAAGGGRSQSARQEQSVCNSSRDKCLHKASGLAWCLSARAIRTPEHADNLLAGAHKHAARRNPHEIRTQTSRRLH
jgi:hypothetical protein